VDPKTMGPFEDDQIEKPLIIFQKKYKQKI